MTLAIRKLEKSDHARWLELWRGYQAFYEADLRADEERLFEALLAPESDGPFCLVCEVDGTIAGITQFLYHKTTWGAERRCYLNDLFTDAAFRGRGVARLLIEAVEERARADGAGQVYWLTQEFNHTARKLYDQVAVCTPFIKYAMRG
ncbi:MAG: GNAT family N-acetyltransferase [Hyphomicrobiales bacterium]|nr:GNAT family N-acetyltransferase [Nitratireductor sp.]MCC2096545.1 GNAT family N-acetyltransferase [Hyphomicrobiales bacterium]